jgi:branched-chain amino acid transport system substrate-binding protein
VFRDEFGKTGGKITAFEKLRGRNLRLQRAAREDQGHQAEVLFLPNYYNDRRPHRQAGEGHGDRRRVIGGDGWDSPDSQDRRKGGRGRIFLNHFSTDSQAPAAKKFVGDYKAKFNKDPDALAALAYEAAMIVVDSIKAGQDSDPKAIRDAMKATNLGDAHRGGPNSIRTAIP